MQGHNNKEMLAHFLEQAYLEVIPTPTIMNRLEHTPKHAYVSITCSPAQGLEPTLALVEDFAEMDSDHQLKLVPHIAARSVRDKGHLTEILKRLNAARVESVFVPGGDSAQPVGAYADSLELLRDMAEIGHDIEDVGIAAHPEGHPLVDDQRLMSYLKEKQQFATYIVTQMCFDPKALAAWVEEIREAGVSLPVWIGLPGVADIVKLISISLRIGVGQSVKLLKKQKGLLAKMISTKPYKPDDLLEGLAPYIGHPKANIAGFHLFSFNDVERTEKWRVESFENLSKELQ